MLASGGWGVGGDGGAPGCVSALTTSCSCTPRSLFGLTFFTLASPPSGYPTLPLTSNYWRFEPALFSRAPIPSAAFAVPAGCTSMCEMTSMTYRERLDARAARGIGGGNLVRHE